MKKYWSLFFALVCAASLSACGKNEEVRVPIAAENEFIVTVACSSKGIQQVGYSSYIDGEYRTMGGGLELDGNSASGCTLEFHFTADDFQDEDDISQFSMTLSPYRNEEEIATTEPVAISAEYGKTYTIDLSGDDESGFAASLKEM